MQGSQGARTHNIVHVCGCTAQTGAPIILVSFRPVCLA